MAAASNLVNGGVAALQIEGEPEEPQSQTNAAAALAPVPWLPSVAERYERREKLGEGMFGDVYEAWDRVHDHLVAVKRLSGRTNDRFVKTSIPEFAREVMSLAACRGHPSIVQLLATHVDGNRADGDCFAVTEHAGPMNLRQYMDARRANGDPFDEDEVRDVMRQLLAGAEHTHGAGVLHRNIVPENVVVGMDGATSKMVYKICGFGMSKPAAQTDKDDSGLLASPSPYRAPELFLGSKDYDGRVDTWSLGCIMAELVTGAGVPFFGGALDKEVFDKMMHVVGTKGIVKWQGLERVAPREKVASLQKVGHRERGYLHKMFPPKVLSSAGFKVLEGLLHSNPDRRLSAADALRMPWFRRRCSLGACFMPHGASMKSG
ncbi:putative cyclin-dependent kinase F-2 [Zea mays]|jgi:cell division cycle 2-like|uniref:Protein kinase domain containing protein n=1 Tax=Zea mays TaxID=4577 RepID=A0A1D6GHW0_MAIZE|nr:putative cyclin-dependent kinase F-2 [Zea mays]AQK63044.1 Protein kinase domain containing protein [Zea mays]|eukprot:XP_008644515.1 putative cyclin-dependent kinase F-2 [Zea mays]